MAKQRTAEQEQGGDGSDELAEDQQALAQHEEQLARYLQDRIKPGLSRGAIPLLARSIAKEITRQEPPEQIDGKDAPDAGDGPAPDFEADMHELQAELGDDWILSFSVHGEDAWLTAEKQDSSQRIEAETADELLKAYDDAMDSEEQERAS
jgi:hypothetical protein